jgi:hypothetical protein
MHRTNTCTRVVFYKSYPHTYPDAADHSAAGALDVSD